MEEVREGRAGGPKRTTYTLSDDARDSVDHWSKRRGRNKSEWVEAAIREKAAREAGDYDLTPGLELRYNQLLAVNAALIERLSGVEAMVGDMYRSFRAAQDAYGG